MPGLETAVVATGSPVTGAGSVATVITTWWGTTLDLGAAGERLGAVIVIVIVGLITIRLAHLFVSGVVRALFAREAAEGTSKDVSAIELRKRTETIETLAVNVIRFFVVVAAALMILQGAFGFDIGPAIAGLGIVGIAVGLGTQSLVRDYLNGALILLENQYARGDVIRVAGVSGKVEDFTLRRTTLRDLDGTVHTVPNSQITVASNLTRVWARINQDIQVVYGTNIDKAIGIVDRVGRELASDESWGPRILEAPRVERVSELGEFGITLKVLGMVRASEQWAVGGEFRKRLLDAFHAEGVEIPQPQKVILSRAPGPEGADRAAGEVLGLLEATRPDAASGPAASGDGPGASGAPAPGS